MANHSDKRVKKYDALKVAARDCKCLLITPEELEELQDANPEKALALFSKIGGMVRK